jgi:hypothetical protein
VEEVDDCPGHAGGAVEDGEYDDPREEEDEDVGRPHARIREPLRIPVQIRRRHCSDVHVLWPFSPSQYSQMTDLSKTRRFIRIGSYESSGRRVVDVARREKGERGFTGYLEKEGFEGRLGISVSIDGKDISYIPNQMTKRH